ncbi:hypothetical protein BV898_18292 [Hypsibius exemplaris]|uniref:Apple domain-containing protein n=1 Tax=Hypsibius exemplaris TaxID=2072580 RepID=A0A9X6NJR1_HYPEX|nr:hypothetical protein BV898_18292 [Hypsibius exemplaris]
MSLLLVVVVCLACGCPAVLSSSDTRCQTDASRSWSCGVEDPDSIVVVVVGWGIFFPTDFVSNSTLNLGLAVNGRACLSKCSNREIRGCRLVSFNVDTGVCTGYTKDLEGTFVPNPSTTLLAVSGKQFHERPGFHFAVPGQTLLLGVDGRAMGNGGTVYNPSVCRNLCHIHPKCISLYSIPVLAGSCDCKISAALPVSLHADPNYSTWTI